MISQRTKAALQAAKERGITLGNPNGAAALRDGCRAAAARSAAVRTAKASQREVAARRLVEQLTEGNRSSYRQIALQLNRQGMPSAAGGTWHPEQVRRLLASSGRKAEAG